MTIAHGAPDDTVGGAVALPRPPGVIRRWGTAHPRIVDWLIAVGSQLPVLAISIVLAAVDETNRLTAVGMLAVSVAAGGVLLARRRWPFLVTLACGLLAIVPSEAAAGAFVAIFVALYSLGAYGRSLQTWIGFAAVSLASIVASLLMPDSSTQVGAVVSVNIVGIACYLIAILAGTSVRARRAYVDALIARASDLERDRDRQAQLATAAERARIAREMHDVVSHGLTVMVTLAEGSAAQANRDPERAADTMRRVADTGRESLSEMRRLLGVLREPGDGGDRAPQPSAGDLHALVASFREAGMPVRLTTSGASLDDSSLALTVHRIVQEALTNVLRHASDAEHVDVSVQHADDGVTVEVADDGTGARATTTGGGRGIVGIRERVAMFDGEVEAGPRSPVGWRLRARLEETVPS